MATGIIYIMSTAVKGLIKIGKTQTGQFETRMNHLESNGYFNVVGLKREFAIEVEDYGKKEDLLHEVFGRSRVAGSELFSVDLDLAKQLMSSFKGKVIYPKNETQEEVFDNATADKESTFILSGKHRDDNKEYSGTLSVRDGKYILKKDSILAETGSKYKNEGWAKLKESLKLDANGRLMEDVETNSPSMAGSIVTGRNTNGKTDWKNSNGMTIGEFLKNKGE